MRTFSADERALVEAVADKLAELLLEWDADVPPQLLDAWAVEVLDAVARTGGAVVTPAGRAPLQDVHPPAPPRARAARRLPR